MQKLLREMFYMKHVLDEIITEFIIFENTFFEYIYLYIICIICYYFYYCYFFYYAFNIYLLYIIIYITYYYLFIYNLYFMFHFQNIFVILYIYAYTLELQKTERQNNFFISCTFRISENEYGIKEYNAS